VAWGTALTTRVLPSHWSIRTRIAVTIFTVSATLLLLMAGTVFLMFRKALLDSFDEAVRARAAANVNLLDANALHLRFSAAASPAFGQESYIRLYGADGVPTDASNSAPALNASEASAVSGALSGRTTLASSKVGHTHYRLAALPLMRDGAPSGVLVTALSYEETRETLDLLQAILLVAVPATSVALAVGASLIARRALRPVHSITRAAREIADGDLELRIEGVTSQDELGELALTFNDMIMRLAATIDRERRFTGDAAHELRTPLTAMETAIDVTLARSRSREEYEATLRSVQGQVDRMVHMTRQLLLLSRLDTSSAPLESQPVSLGELLEELVQGFAQSHPDTTVRYASPSADTVIEGDAELLARALTNVLENTLVHAAGQPRSIDVAVTASPTLVTVTVADDGAGFPAELVGSDFQRFRRGDASRSTGGSGLGLTIAASITLAHGGRLTASNAAGAVVLFEFPRTSDT
jgi:two-component system OmpR family sensor kinase